MAKQRRVTGPDGGVHAAAHVEVRRVKVCYPEKLIVEVDVYHSSTAFAEGKPPVGRQVVVEVERAQAKLIDKNLQSGFIASLAAVKLGVQKALPYLQAQAGNGGEGKLMWLSDDLSTATEVEDLFHDWTPDTPAEAE